MARIRTGHRPFVALQDTIRNIKAARTQAERQRHILRAKKLHSTMAKMHKEESNISKRIAAQREIQKLKQMKAQLRALKMQKYAKAMSISRGLTRGAGKLLRSLSR